MPLGKITPGAIRVWNASVAERHPATTAAKAYRLFEFTHEDGGGRMNSSARNPCQLKGGAERERPTERPVASISGGRGDRRCRCLLTSKIACSTCFVVPTSPWGIAGARRRDVDLLRGMPLRSFKRRGPKLGGGEIIKAPENKRWAPIGSCARAHPSSALRNHDQHLDKFVDVELDSRLPGRGRRRSGRITALRALQESWEKATGQDWSGLTSTFTTSDTPGLLGRPLLGRHLAELMRRAGHKSPVAAIRYQHATEDRDRVLASALARLAKSAEIVPLARAMDRAMKGEPESLGLAVGGENMPTTRDDVESGRRESNPRSQLGKLMFCL